jgi:4-hydroxy-tetrahydrodipicolinate reductase
MNIALIGYGKMGQLIEAIATERGHTIVAKISSHNQQDFKAENLQTADVAIEFTGPASAYSNVKKSLDLGLPTLSGSTGWNQQLAEIRQYCKEINGTFLHASNFSIGVNIFFEVNRLLARLMAGKKDYNVSLKEIHHTQKKDAPSGTAVTLAEQILAELTNKTKWVNSETKESGELAIISERIDPAPGTHIVKYSSDIDDIEITHTAHSRKGFALGAVLAAEFILGKTGVFEMPDVLNTSP